MADRKYIYSGPLSSATIRVDGKDRHVQLHPGASVTLPPDHPWVKRLIAQKRLAEPGPEPKPEAATVSRRATKPDTDNKDGAK